jgi:hypothetical protein
MFQKLEAIGRGQMADISPASRQQIVNADDLMTLGKEAFAEMRAYEAGAPGNDRSQSSPPDTIFRPDTINCSTDLSTRA